MNEKVDYGWYHKNTMIFGLIFGSIALIIFIYSFILSGFFRIIFSIFGILGLMVFLWPALGLFAINIRTDNNRSHPTVNYKEILELKDPKILDIGCGSGRCAIQFAKNLKNGGQIFGIDIFNNALSGNSLEKVRTNARIENVSSKITFKYGSITEIPFEKHFFDVVNVSYVLHEIPDKEKALSEIYRVLKPNGWLFITEFHKRNLFTFLYNGLFTFHYKNPHFWVNLLIKNRFNDVIYANSGPIGIVSALK
jgi:ubiquinone/menaquinone biosynthesis C-methylase UbiE